MAIFRTEVRECSVMDLPRTSPMRGEVPQERQESRRSVASDDLGAERLAGPEIGRDGTSRGPEAPAARKERAYGQSPH